MGLLGGETVHRYAAEAFGETLGEAEVELADRGGVARSHLFERTAPQNEGNLTASLAAGRSKAILRQLLLQDLDGIALLGISSSSLEAGLTPDLVWTQVVLQGPTEQSGQPRVRPRRRPLAGRLGVQAVEQTWTPRNVPPLHLFTDEVGLLQYGEMLAYRVVVQSHVLGEFRHSNRPVSVDDVAEQAVARRVAEGPGLELNVVRVHESPREVTGATLRFLVYARINNSRLHASAWPLCCAMPVRRHHVGSVRHVPAARTLLYRGSADVVLGACRRSGRPPPQQLGGAVGEATDDLFGAPSVREQTHTVPCVNLCEIVVAFVASPRKGGMRPVVVDQAFFISRPSFGEVIAQYPFAELRRTRNAHGRVNAAGVNGIGLIGTNDPEMGRRWCKRFGTKEERGADSRPGCARGQDRGWALRRADASGREDGDLYFLQDRLEQRKSGVVVESVTTAFATTGNNNIDVSGLRISCILGVAHLRGEQDVGTVHTMYPRTDVGESKGDEDWLGVECRV